MTATKDNSYGALNSNSITSFKTELNEMPVSADIFAKSFMDDIAATNVEDMVQNFAAGAGVTSGSGTPANAATSNQPGDRNSGAAISLRGLATGTFTLRNGFYPSTQTGIGMTSVFDLDRVEVISGPQALLFGAGGGGGVINYVTKQAKFNSAPATELRFQIDDYGKKLGAFDFNVGSKRLAMRVSLINQQVGGRRDFIGGNFIGGYVQLAAKPFDNTTVRVEYERTSYTRITPSGLTVTGLSTANDSRHNQRLRYLLATNQIEAPASGPNGLGPILNGKVNWDNADSFSGAMTGEIRRIDFITAQVDTVWTRWLSTRVAGGYTDIDNTKTGNSGVSLLAPNATANPTATTATPSWVMGLNSSSTGAGQLVQPGQIKNLRVSGVITNDFFRGRAHSQTVFGGDYTRRADNTTGLGYMYVLGDSDFRPILLPSVNGVPPQNNGFQNLPVKYWAVPNGPVKYPLWGGGRPDRFTVDGQNYVLTIPNYPDPSKVGPNNPLGLSGYGLGQYRLTRTVQKGFYFANFTKWLDNRLTTLAGVRINNVNTLSFSENGTAATKLAIPSSGTVAGGEGVDYSFGVNYAMRPWFRPYVSLSTTQAPPSNVNQDPLGRPQKIMKSVGGEIGAKMQNLSGSVSGSISLFRIDAKNEQTSIDASLVTLINPAGLNGRVGISPNAILSLDRQSEGLQAVLTATPKRNLRMRLAASYQQAVVKSGDSIDQVYNDQFYANSRGEVTYRDGTPVYVIKDSRTVAVTATAAPGSEPLTIALMSTPPSTGSTNAYYANPAANSGAINASSGAAIVLQGRSSANGAVDPNVARHGPILTGAVGLPISALQIVMPANAQPVGSVPVARIGERAQGSPGLTFNYEAMHTFEQGALRGFRIGGSYQGSWRNGMFYYYPNTLTRDRSTRALFEFPTKCIFSGVLGYDWKWHRTKVSTQVNVHNMFNHYHVVIVPNTNNGFTGISPLDATFDQQPRTYVWSMRVNF